jgi:hypothetical protein
LFGCKEGENEPFTNIEGNGNNTKHYEGSDGKF